MFWKYYYCTIQCSNIKLDIMDSGHFSNLIALKIQILRTSEVVFYFVLFCFSFQPWLWGSKGCCIFFLQLEEGYLECISFDVFHAMLLSFIWNTVHIDQCGSLFPVLLCYGSGCKLVWYIFCCFVFMWAVKVSHVALISYFPTGVSVSCIILVDFMYLN